MKFKFVFYLKDGRLEVWDIAKQNMDPIFRLDIDQPKKNHLLPLETIEESEENSLGHLKKNIKSEKLVNSKIKLKKRIKIKENHQNKVILQVYYFLVNILFFWLEIHMEKFMFSEFGDMNIFLIKIVIKKIF